MSMYLCLLNTLPAICSMYCDTQAEARGYEPDDYTTARPVLRQRRLTRHRRAASFIIQTLLSGRGARIETRRADRRYQVSNTHVGPERDTEMLRTYPLVDVRNRCTHITERNMINTWTEAYVEVRCVLMSLCLIQQEIAVFFCPPICLPKVTGVKKSI